jgi:hypothetical protein
MRKKLAFIAFAAAVATAFALTPGPAARACGGVVYENRQYGFVFYLPEAWRGYTILESQWNGTLTEGAQENAPALSGPVVTIRDPRWTKENPRQDIPVLVFTPEQWELVRQEKLAVSAAPIPPSELGRNGRYVFALPARYNFAFPPGWEEVEDILSGKPLRPLRDCK